MICLFECVLCACLESAELEEASDCLDLESQMCCHVDAEKFAPVLSKCTKCSYPLSYLSSPM